LDCKNIIDGTAIDLAKGCPICGCRKFEYVRTKKAVKPGITVAEYVSQVAASEPQPILPERKHEDIGIDYVKARANARPEVKAKTEAKAEHKAKAPAAKKAQNDRIESVRILEKGHYDINLPVLLNRKELVMSKEDGVYIVDLPSALKAPHKKKK
jgi:hypothetical protein